MRWIVSIIVVVAALAVAFLYLRSISVLSSVIAGVSTLAPKQGAHDTSLAASPSNAPANVSSELAPSASLAIAPTSADHRHETKDPGPSNQIAQAPRGSKSKRPWKLSMPTHPRLISRPLLWQPRRAMAEQGTGGDTRTAGTAQLGPRHAPEKRRGSGQNEPVPLPTHWREECFPALDLLEMETGSILPST
ncbi:MAG: hypothetical protein E6J65_28520 [Deltaproteobacteria bacterium]|nr:MAG: hypothetical protein E6J65_28520 [Deltaproteobacteria bacterium]